MKTRDLVHLMVGKLEYNAKLDHYRRLNGEKDDHYGSFPAEAAAFKIELRGLLMRVMDYAGTEGPTTPIILGPNLMDLVREIRDGDKREPECRHTVGARVPAGDPHVPTIDHSEVDVAGDPRLGLRTRNVQ